MPARAIYNTTMPGKNFLQRPVFFIGWMLSPFTFWNDAFVNIPVSYLCANLFVKVFPANFLITVIVFYWLSNVLGLLLMYVTGKGVIAEKGGVVKGLLDLIVTSLVYSIILVMIYKVGILKPFRR